MKGIKRFLRRIRLRYVALVFFGIIALFVLVLVINLSLPDQAGSLYGSRLDGIENHPIEDTKITAIKAEILDNTNVKTVNYILKGKTINFMINLEKSINVEDAKSFSDVVLTGLTEDQKTFYDIQVFITSLEASDNYPIIGYKHYSSDVFSWVNKNI